MHRLHVFLVGCLVWFGTDVSGELSSKHCSVIRTATSISTIVPELAQLALRHYRTSSSPVHQRQKRFFFNDGAKDGSSSAKSSVIEQVMANSLKDVNFTRVALLVLNNNETMNKLRQNVDSAAILRAIMREVDYEKLGSGLWSAAAAEFDLEHFVSSVINVTHLDIIHAELVTNGTLPDWMIRGFHPDLNPAIVHQMFDKLKNLTNNFVRIMTDSKRLDEYLFDIVSQQILTPLTNIVQQVKTDKPRTLDRILEIFLDNIDKEQIKTTKPPSPTKKSGKNAATSTIDTPEISEDDDVGLLLYQWSIGIDSMGKTARIFLQSLDKLYCALSW